jgi:hypothetical protein
MSHILHDLLSTVDKLKRMGKADVVAFGAYRVLWDVKADDELLQELLCDSLEASFFERLDGRLFVRFNISNNRAWDGLLRNHSALRVYAQFMAERGVFFMAGQPTWWDTWRCVSTEDNLWSKLTAPIEHIRAQWLDRQIQHQFFGGDPPRGRTSRWACRVRVNKLIN